MTAHAIWVIDFKNNKKEHWQIEPKFILAQKDLTSCLGEWTSANFLP